MNPTEIMYEEAERFWKESGGKHGYSGVTYGVAEVLRRNGLATDYKELAKIFHDPLADFHSHFEAGKEVTFEQIAKAIDIPRGFRHDTRPRVSHPFDRIGESNVFPYPMEGPPSVAIDVSWMENEVDSHLKKEKIRRGTKRYAEFISTNKHKVIKASKEAAEKAKVKAQEKLQSVFKELDKLHDEAISSHDYANRRATIRRAILDVAGMEGDPAYNEYETRVLEFWGQVIANIEGQAAYLEEAVNDTDTDLVAQHALEAREKLRPFLED